MTWWPLVLAVVLHNAPRLIQSLRWAYLLRPARVRQPVLLHAIFVGILASGIFPLCPNELVRGIVVARRAELGVARVFTSEAIERVADAVALLAVVWLTLRGLPIPYMLEQALWVLCGIVAVLIVAGALLTIEQRRLQAALASREPQRRWGRIVKEAASQVLEGARAVRGWTMPVCISAGLAITLLHVVSMWLILYAYHVHLSFLHAAAVYGIVTVGTLLPSAPASVGAWQFFCIVGLELFGVPGTRAAGFSMVAFAVFTIPALLGGVAALLITPISWAGLRRLPSSKAPASRSSDEPPYGFADEPGEPAETKPPGLQPSSGCAGETAA